ncbi:MAG: carboxypeptidase regulatory-like domain-containing protein [Bacteroidales bacterium]|jgi:hypothetical protein
MNARIFKKIIKTTFAGLMIVALVGVSSCRKTEEPAPTPEPQPAKYTIKGTVINQATNAALPGVLVTMGALTATTTATGSFEFANLTTAGKYTLILTKADFFSATYSIEFQTAGPNHTIVYTITATMVPFVPGVTPLNPIIGGVIPVTGGDIATSLTIPANTTVTDKNGVPVTGNINITAVTTSDIVIAGVNNNPGLVVLRFEPSGLQFSKPLPLVVDNPISGYRFSQMQLEFFNALTTLWEVQTQPVTFVTATNDYSTSITHFSLYKLSFTHAVTELAATTLPIIVTDNIIRNNSLVNLAVTKIRYKRNSGYLLEKPILTSLSDVGITGTDATELAELILEVVKNHFNGIAPVTAYTVSDAELAVVRTVLPKYKLVTIGTQKIVNKQFTISLVKLSDSTTKTVIIKVNSADMVTLSMDDVIFDAHDHELGGGGSN